MNAHEIFHRRLGANSGLIGTFWKTDSGDFRPRTTGDKGQWSGIRYNMKEIFNSQSHIILYIDLYWLICI